MFTRMIGLARLRLLLIFLVSIPSWPALAQGPAVPSASLVAAQPRQPSVLRPIAIGAGAGAAGLFLGVAVGAGAMTGCGSEDCQLIGAVIGASVGTTLGIVLGTHLGNRRYGNLFLDLLAAVGAGALMVAQDDSGTPLEVIAIPVTQLAATVAMERLVGHAKLSALTVAPLPKGGVAVGVRLPLGFP